MNVSTTHVPMVHSVLMVSTTSRAIVDRGIRENAVKPVRLGLRLDYVLESICSRSLSFSCDNEIKGAKPMFWLATRAGKMGLTFNRWGLPRKKKRKTKVTKRHTIFVIFGEFQGWVEKAATDSKEKREDTKDSRGFIEPKKKKLAFFPFSRNKQVILHSQCRKVFFAM